MNRIDRLMGIVTILQSKKYCKAETLADIFEISKRTVFRDLKSLEELGIPIGFENRYGYFISPGFFLPPVSFTKEEANSFVLVEALVKRFSDKSVFDNYSSALNKIKATLKHSEKDSMETMDSHITVHVPNIPNINADFLSKIQNSITNKKILKMDYINNSKLKSTREIEPIGLVFYSLNWHVIAWCWYRGEYRDFKIPGIINMTETNEDFRRKKHTSLNDYIDLILQKNS